MNAGLFHPRSWEAFLAAKTDLVACQSSQGPEPRAWRVTGHLRLLRVDADPLFSSAMGTAVDLTRFLPTVNPLTHFFSLIHGATCFRVLSGSSKKLRYSVTLEIQICRPLQQGGCFLMTVTSSGFTFLRVPSGFSTAL